jgi:hypothetical protein
MFFYTIMKLFITLLENVNKSPTSAGRLSLTVAESGEKHEEGFQHQRIQGSRFIICLVWVAILIERQPLGQKIRGSSTRQNWRFS